MLEQLEKDIAQIKENISTLPTNNKQNRQKVLDYINETEARYTKKLEEVKEEILRRKDVIEHSYDAEVNFENEDISFEQIKCLNPYSSSEEKMGLNRQYYKFEHFLGDDLAEINNDILNIIAKFNTLGVKITEKDFIYSENVNQYIKTLLHDKENIYKVFDEIYFKTPDLIYQIELNIKYIYLKNKKIIDKKYIEDYSKFSLNTICQDAMYRISQNENIKHNNRKYLFDLLHNKEIAIADFSEKSIEALKSSILEKGDREYYYNDLIKLKFLINEYKLYLKFEYIIKDFKELYSKKNEYKGLYTGKLKEIAKKESKLFGITKKLFKTGFGAMNESKKNIVRIENQKIINELKQSYKELDDLKIKDAIFNNIKDDSNYIDILRMVSCNYDYFVKVYSQVDDNINIDDIDTQLESLYKLAYATPSNIISNILINEDKNIATIIKEKYSLSNISIKEDNLTADSLGNFEESINKLIVYFDLLKNNINIDEINYILSVEKNILDQK